MFCIILTSDNIVKMPFEPIKGKIFRKSHDIKRILWELRIFVTKMDKTCIKGWNKAGRVLDGVNMNRKYTRPILKKKHMLQATTFHETFHFLFSGIFW